MSSSSSSASSPRSALSRASSQTSLDSNDVGPKDTFKDTIEQIDPLESVATSNLPSVRKVCFVGAGYVGGPTAGVLAYCNPNIEVTVVDMNANRIRAWQSKHLPIHEPGLIDIVRIARDGANRAEVSSGRRYSAHNILPARDANLFFSTDCDRHIASADIVFLSVNTPTKMSGSGAGSATDISMFEAAASSIAQVAKAGAIIVEKSTVPCRTAQVVRDIFEFYRPGVPFEVLSNPEFLAEGTAVNDLLKPSRVLIGSSNTPAGRKAAQRLTDVYAAWVPRSSILCVDVWSSELAKLVANAMLAQRISSINSVSAICERTGANVDDVAKACGMDPRLGSKFLKAGLGFGGSCFKKDVLSLSYLAASLDLPEVSAYWRQVVEMNQWQCSRFVKLLVKTLNGSLRGKKIALLGYAFKKDTSDTRESQAAEVVRQLLPEGPSEIAIFDPQCNRRDVEDELTSFFASGSTPVLKPQGVVRVCTSPYEACSDATAIVVLTEWSQFSYPPSKPKLAMLESVHLSTRHIKPALDERRQSDMDALERRAVVQDTLSTLQSTHVRPDPQNDSAGRFRPEPACGPDCRDCTSEREVAQFASENLDWPRVAGMMRGPKWVFDGRGLVDLKAMEELGFSVLAIGRASTQSRLRAE